jgi:hypothetical protein
MTSGGQRPKPIINPRARAAFATLEASALVNIRAKGR